MNKDDADAALKINKGRGFNAEHEGSKYRVVNVKSVDVQPAENLDTAVKPEGKKIKKQKLDQKHFAVTASGLELPLESVSRL